MLIMMAPIFAMISSAFILATNFLILHIYENLSERMESQKQQIIFNKQIELCKTKYKNVKSPTITSGT